MTVSENNLGRNFTDRHIKEKVILRKIKKKRTTNPKQFHIFTTIMSTLWKSKHSSVNRKSKHPLKTG